MGRPRNDLSNCSDHRRGLLRLPSLHKEAGGVPTCDHQTVHFSLGSPRQRVLLRAQIEVANSGLVLIKLEEGIFRVDRVLPLADGMAEAVVEQQPPSDGELAINWPPIENRPYKWPTPPEIEPEEAEVVVCDFVLPPGLQTVQVYTWFKNVSKEGEIGWAASSFYDLPDGRVGQSATKEFQPVTGSQEPRA
jgi:hypothetical protein